MSLDETDSESWQSSGELRRSLKTVARFCHQIAEKKKWRDLEEQRFREEIDFNDSWSGETV